MFTKLFKKKESDSKEETLNYIIRFLKTSFPDEVKNINLTGDTELSDLGIDSIKYINLLLGLEQLINCDIEDIVDDIDISSIISVNDMVELVNKINNSENA